MHTLYRLDSRHTNTVWEDELGCESDELAIAARFFDKLKEKEGNMLRVLHGIDTEAEGTMQNDQALLMEVLEIREAVEDAESYDEDIRPLLEANAVSVASCMENVSRLLSEPDPDGAKAMVTRWQYYEKIREEIELWKDRNAVE